MGSGWNSSRTSATFTEYPLNGLALSTLPEKGAGAVGSPSGLSAKAFDAQEKGQEITPPKEPGKGAPVEKEVTLEENETPTNFSKSRKWLITILASFAFVNA